MTATSLLDLLRDYLRAEEWPFEEVPGHSALRSGFQGEHGAWTCILQTFEEDRQVLFYSILHEFTPEEHRDEMARFITRANYGMRIGSFEMDYDDGEVRFRTSIDVEGGELTPTMIRNLVGLNVSVVNHYFRALHEVMYGAKSAEQAIAEAEAGLVAAAEEAELQGPAVEDETEPLVDQLQRALEQALGRGGGSGNHGEG